MLKVTSLLVGLLTVLSIAPASQAMATSGKTLTIDKPAENLQAQLVISVDRNPEHKRLVERDRQHHDEYNDRQYDEYANGNYDRRYENQQHDNGNYNRRDENRSHDEYANGNYNRQDDNRQNDEY